MFPNDNSKTINGLFLRGNSPACLVNCLVGEFDEKQGRFLITPEQFEERVKNAENNVVSVIIGKNTPSSMNSLSFPTQTKPQSFRDLGYSGKPWVSFSGKRFVQTFSIDPGKPGNFGHASLFGQVTEGDQENMWIFIVECRRQIFINFFIVLKIIKGIVWAGFYCIHIVLLERVGNFLRYMDIFFLTGFIAAKQEQYNDTIADSVYTDDNLGRRKAALHKPHLQGF